MSLETDEIARLAGWFSMQIQFTLETFGQNPDVKGYIKDFITGLRPELAQYMAENDCLDWPEYNRIAREVWDELRDG